MEGKRRRRLSAQAWREVLDRQAASGVGVSAFCEREGLGENSFYRWRQMLKVKAEAASAPAKLEAAFVDLGSLEPGSGKERLDLKLELGGGLTLHLTRG